MWFYILKLIKISLNPLKDLIDILCVTSKNNNKIDNILFVSLFETVMFSLVYLPKLLSNDSIKIDLEHIIEPYSKMYSQKVKVFLQSDDLYSPLLSNEWKEGFVEIFQYFLKIQPVIGWSMMIELHEPFVQSDAGFGVAFFACCSCFFNVPSSK